MEVYTGTRLVQVKGEVIDQLYRDKFLDLDPENRAFDKRLRFAVQNEYIHLQSITSNQSAVTRVKGDRLYPIKETSMGSVKPRNLEQRMLVDALMDPSILVIVITGRAGTGKTLLTLAAAIAQLDNGEYNRLILTKPMSQVGKYQLGILPGEVDQKFQPYLDNYIDNIEHFLGGKYQSVDQLFEKYRMDFKPLQLIRGASWQGAFVICDECQVLDYHEMVTLGTRVGEGSKIIIMGDMNQRDEKIQVEKTGMYKFLMDKRVQECNFTASIQLEKSERGIVSKLFADVFEV